VLWKEEKSPRVLSLTADAIMLNAANYTVWQYRRDVLQDLRIPTLITKNGLNEEFEKEFEFSRQMIEDNQKNYQVWHHRKMLVSWAAGYDDESREILLKCEEAKEKLAKMELDLTEKILQKDAKNYHAWQHRQWVLGTFNMFQNELEYVSELIEDDVRNNSAWNERYFVLSSSPHLTIEDLFKDIQYTWECISLAMSNESPWNYMRGLFLLFKRLKDESALARAKADVLNRCLQHYKHGNRSVPLMGFIVELVVEKLELHCCPEDMYSETVLICDSLLEKDTIRKNYWDHVKANVISLHDSNSKKE